MLVRRLTPGYATPRDPTGRALPSRHDEVLAFLDTGAYQDATASNFNAMGRPATILVDGDDAEAIKTAETLEQLLARERVPERLR